MEIKSKKNNKNNNIVRIIALIVLCFVFCLPLFACNDPIYNHVISVTSSNIQKGTVSGSGTYKTNKNVTLTATPKSGYSFIAWIKNEVIVSQDAEFTFTANKETEGKYTALFTTDTLEFFMITNVSYDINGLSLTTPTTLTNISNIDITSGTTAGLYQNLANLQNVEMNNTGNLSATGFNLSNKVFYINKIYYYNIKISYTYLDQNSNSQDSVIETDISVDFSNLNNIQEENGIKSFSNDYYTLTQNKLEDNNYQITLSINTLKTPSNWSSNSQHCLTLTFSYPFQLNNE